MGPVHTPDTQHYLPTPLRSRAYHRQIPCDGVGRTCRLTKRIVVFFIHAPPFYDTSASSARALRQSLRSPSIAPRPPLDILPLLRALVRIFFRTSSSTLSGNTFPSCAYAIRRHAEAPNGPTAAADPQGSPGAPACTFLGRNAQDVQLGAHLSRQNIHYRKYSVGHVPHVPRSCSLAAASGAGPSTGSTDPGNPSVRALVRALPHER